MIELIIKKIKEKKKEWEREKKSCIIFFMVKPCFDNFQIKKEHPPPFFLNKSRDLVLIRPSCSLVIFLFDSDLHDDFAKI